MMKQVLGSKALSRALSFLLMFSMIFCQLPTAVWADDTVAALYSEESTDDPATMGEETPAAAEEQMPAEEQPPADEQGAQPPADKPSAEEQPPVEDEQQPPADEQDEPADDEQPPVDDFMGGLLDKTPSEARGELGLLSRAVALSGDGTEDSPYLIRTAADMQKLAAEVAGGNNCADSFFRLEADMTLTGEWTPIGTQAAPFAGHFDGDGHTISGIKITNAAADYQGLFGYLSGTVRDLTVAGEITSTGRYVGGVAGYLVNGEIANCVNNVQITVTTAQNMANVGGIVGSSTGTVTGCRNTAAVSANQSRVGGVVGTNMGAVTQVVNTGAVSARAYVGGMVGYNDGELIAAENSGNVTASGNYAGGVMGRGAEAASQLYAHGCTVSAADYAAGLAGGGDVSNALINGVTLPADAEHKGSFTADGTAAFAYDAAAADEKDLKSGKLAWELSTDEGAKLNNGFWAQSAAGPQISAGDSPAIYRLQFTDYSGGRVSAAAYAVGGKTLTAADIYADGGVTVLYATGGSSLTVTLTPAAGADMTGFVFEPALSGGNNVYTGTVSADTKYEFGFKPFPSEQVAERYNWYLNDPTAAEYEISTAAEFAGFADIVNGTARDAQGVEIPADTFAGKTVTLTADIDLVDFCGPDKGSWTPVAVSYQHNFQGIFDGGGHLISGLYINEEAPDDDPSYGSYGYYALFGQVGVTAARIKNLAVDGSITLKNISDPYVGGIVCEGRRCTVFVENCASSVDIDVTLKTGNDGCQIGGIIAGNSQSMRCYQCSYSGNMTVKILTSGWNFPYVGGISGYGQNNNALWARDCVNTGTLTVPAENQKAFSAAGIYTGSNPSMNSNSYRLIYAGTFNDSGAVQTSFFPMAYNKRNNLVDAYSLENSATGLGYADSTELSAAAMHSPYLAYTLKEKAGGFWGLGEKSPDMLLADKLPDVTVSPVYRVQVKNYTADKYAISFVAGSDVTMEAQNGAAYLTPGELRVKVTPQNGAALSGFTLRGADVKDLGNGEYAVTVTDADLTLECGSAEDINAAEGSAANLGWYSADTTADNFYINTAAELEAFSRLVNGTVSGFSAYNFSGKTVHLNADIDLSAYANWQAIGTQNNPFAGAFDGAGHKISGLSVNSTADYQGLFGYVTGSIDKLGVDGTVRGGDFIGGIAGYAKKLTNSYSTAAVSATANNAKVGGLSGKADSAQGCFYYKEGAAVAALGADSTASGVYYLGAAVSGGVGTAMSAAGFTGREIAWGLDVASGQHAKLWQVGDPYPTMGLPTTKTEVNEETGEEETVVVPYDGSNTVYKLTLTPAADAGGTVSMVSTAEIPAFSGKAGDAQDAATYWYAYVLDGERVKLAYTAADNKEPYITPTGSDIKTEGEYYVYAAGDDAALTYKLYKRVESDLSWYTANPEAESFEVATEAQLRGMALLVGGMARDSKGQLIEPVSFEGKTVKLSANINISAGSEPWLAIGNGTNSFKGAFDGNGKTVAGYTIDTAESYQGLFGYLGEGGKIADLTVNGTVKGAEPTGGVVGCAADNSTLENCTNNGAVTGAKSTGGIAGKTGKGATVTGCRNNGAVSGTEHVGGIAGDIDSNGTLTNSANTGKITGSGRYVGGLVGNPWSNFTASGCQNSGEITGGGYTGGLFGSVDSASAEAPNTITDCENSGKVIGGNNQNIGGIAGGLDAYSTIKGCKNTADVSGDKCVGGIVGVAAEAASSRYPGPVVFEDCSNSGNITGTNSNTHVGGIAGDNKYGGTMINCGNSGNITGVKYVGGVSGNPFDDFTAKACYNTGNVTGTGDYVGGVFGGVDGVKSVVGCYNAGTVSGGTARTAGISADGNGFVGCFNYGQVTAASGSPSAISVGTSAACYYLQGSVADPADAARAAAKTAAEFKSADLAWALNHGDGSGLNSKVFIYKSGDYPTFAGKDDTLKYVLSLGTADNGALTTTAPQYIAAGEAVTVTITPAAGYLMNTYTLTDAAGNAYPNTYTEAANGTVTLSFNMPAEDVSAAATFTAKPTDGAAEYTVTFNGNGGKWADGTTKTKKVASGYRLKAADLPEPPPANGHKEFLGWFTEAACENEYNMQSPVTADTELFAKWANVYEVTLSFAGGTLTLGEGDEAQTYSNSAHLLIEQGTAAAKPEAEPQKPGSRFIGWFTDADALNKYDFAAKPTGDITLYAGFVPEGKVRVIIDANGGLYNGNAMTVLLLDENARIPEPDTAKLTHPDKHNFIGWYTAAASGARWLFDVSRPEGDMTIYAHWQGDDNSISGGTEANPFVIETVEQLLALRQAVNGGNKFIGEYFTLGADLTLPNNWKPIGKDYHHHFAGHFDGAGHTITIPEGAQGLFGIAGGGAALESADLAEIPSITNLTIKGERIEGSAFINDAVYGCLLVENCTLAEGSQTLRSGFANIVRFRDIDPASGGGYHVFSPIAIQFKNCVIEAGATVGYDKQQYSVGGIVGKAGVTTLIECVNLGDVYGVDYVAGLVADGYDRNASVFRCYSGGKISGHNIVGGLVGVTTNDSSMPQIAGINIVDSWSDAEVSGNEYVGGLAATMQPDYISDFSDNNGPTLRNSFFTGKVNGAGYVGALAGRFLYDGQSDGEVARVFGNVRSNFYQPPLAPVEWELGTGASLEALGFEDKDHFTAVTAENDYFANGYAAYLLDGGAGIHSNYWTQNGNMPQLNYLLGKTEENPGNSVYKATAEIDAAQGTVSLNGIAAGTDTDPAVYQKTGEQVSFNITPAAPTSAFDDEGVETITRWVVDKIELTTTKLSYAEDGTTVKTETETETLDASAASFAMPEGNVVVKVAMKQETEVVEPVEDDPEAGDRNDSNHKPTGSGTGTGTGTGSGTGSGVGTGTGTGSGTSTGDGTGSGTGTGSGSGTGSGTGSGAGTGTLVTTPVNSDRTPAATPVNVSPVTEPDVDTPSQVTTPEVEPVEPTTPDVTPEGGSSGGNEGGSEGDEEEVQMTFFEVIRHTLQENPLITALMIILILLIIFAAGYNRYRKNKKQR